MTKTVTCPVCNGYGFTVTTSESSIQSHVCDNCNGSGELEVPMTNGDRIRSMADEELAWELLTWRMEAVAKYHGVSSNFPNTQKTICEWLKQPVEESLMTERSEADA